MKERSKRGKIQNRCFEYNVLEDKNTHKQRKKKIKKNQAEEERREKKIAIAAELLSESEECE